MSPALIGQLIDEGLCRIVAGDNPCFKEYFHQTCSVLAGHSDGVCQLTRILRAFGEQAKDFQLCFIKSHLVRRDL